MKAAPVQQRRLADDIVDRIETLILEGTLKPGERLPAERALAEEFGVSRPSLREARMKTSLCLMGGWNEQGAIAHGPVQDIEAEALDAFEQTNGVKFILAPGCSIPDETPDDLMAAAREAADSL